VKGSEPIARFGLARQGQDGGVAAGIPFTRSNQNQPGDVFLRVKQSEIKRDRPEMRRDAVSGTMRVMFNSLP